MTETPETPEVDPQAAVRQERRQAIIQPLIEGMQQREKFLLSERLGKPYSEVVQDPDRILLALAWKQLKLDAGGQAPDFERLLDMTDAEVLAVLGLDRLDDDDQGAEAADAAGKD